MKRLSLHTLTVTLVSLAGLIAVAALVIAYLAITTAQGAEGREEHREAVQALIQTRNLAASRSHSIEESCYEQNERNRAAVRTLNDEITGLGGPVSPAQRTQIEETRRFTVLLIEALVPIANCPERVKRETQP
jgi:hypothetical protein